MSRSPVSGQDVINFLRRRNTVDTLICADYLEEDPDLLDEIADRLDIRVITFGGSPGILKLITTTQNFHDGSIDEEESDRIPSIKWLPPIAYAILTNRSVTKPPRFCLTCWESIVTGVEKAMIRYYLPQWARNIVNVVQNTMRR